MVSLDITVDNQSKLIALLRDCTRFIENGGTIARQDFKFITTLHILEKMTDILGLQYKAVMGSFIQVLFEKQHYDTMQLYQFIKHSPWFANYDDGALYSKILSAVYLYLVSDEYLLQPNLHIVEEVDNFLVQYGRYVSFSVMRDSLPNITNSLINMKVRIFWVTSGLSLFSEVASGGVNANLNYASIRDDFSELNHNPIRFNDLNSLFASYLPVVDADELLDLAQMVEVAINENLDLPLINGLSNQAKSMSQSLGEILNKANITYNFKFDWDDVAQSAQISSFKEFIQEKIENMADYNNSSKILWKNLSAIIIKMDQSSKFREQCFNIVTVYNADCGDATASAYIEMQLALKNYKDNPTLDDLFSYEKNKYFHNLIKKITIEKIEALCAEGIVNIDEIEVQLAYFIALKEFMGIEIEEMHFSTLSHVNSDDIEKARLRLELILKNEIEDCVYEQLASNNELIKVRYAQEFEKIQNRPEYDTSLNLEGENSAQYSERLTNIQVKLMAEKIAFLKNEFYLERFKSNLFRDKA